MPPQLKKYLLLIFIGILFRTPCFAQIPIIIPLFFVQQDIGIPVYGFVRYHTLNDKSVNLVFQDERKSFDKLFCSEIRVNHHTEFEGRVGMALVTKYFDTLIHNANGNVIDTGPPITVSLQVLSAKLKMRTYGLCQIQIRYAGFERTYCVDLADDNPNSPLDESINYTAQSVIRIMVSAAVREVVEKVISDFAKNL